MFTEDSKLFSLSILTDICHSCNELNVLKPSLFWWCERRVFESVVGTPNRNGVFCAWGQQNCVARRNRTTLYEPGSCVSESVMVANGSSELLTQHYRCKPIFDSAGCALVASHKKIHPEEVVSVLTYSDFYGQRLVKIASGWEDSMFVQVERCSHLFKLRCFTAPFHLPCNRTSVQQINLITL